LSGLWWERSRCRIQQNAKGCCKNLQSFLFRYVIESHTSNPQNLGCPSFSVPRARALLENLRMAIERHCAEWVVSHRGDCRVMWDSRHGLINPPAHAGRGASLPWIPAFAGMTYHQSEKAHVHYVHILPYLASPQGEGFPPSPKGPLITKTNDRWVWELCPSTLANRHSTTDHWLLMVDHR
jgi:hypothetical protein